MLKYEFWKDWNRKTKLEEAVIRSYKAGKKIILKKIPKDEVISIYVRGSFARREVDKRSDIDFLVILNTSNSLKRLKQLNEACKSEFYPEVEIKGYSWWELKTGKRSKNSVSATPSYITAKHLSGFKLIYGKDLSKTQFFFMTDTDDLKELLNAFRNIFLPQYKENKMEFRDLIKQTFWLVDLEQKVKNEKPPHNWKKLEESIKDGRHIVHDALEYRLKPTKDKKERSEYVKKLKQYLEKLDKLV